MQSRKIVQMNLFLGQEQRGRSERGHGDTDGEGEGGRDELGD